MKKWETAEVVEIDFNETEGGHITKKTECTIFHEHKSNEGRGNEYHPNGANFCS